MSQKTPFFEDFGWGKSIFLGKTSKNFFSRGFPPKNRHFPSKKSIFSSKILYFAKGGPMSQKTPFFEDFGWGKSIFWGETSENLFSRGFPPINRHPPSKKSFFSSKIPVFCYIGKNRVFTWKNGKNHVTFKDLDHFLTEKSESRLSIIFSEVFGPAASEFRVKLTIYIILPP